MPPPKTSRAARSQPQGLDRAAKIKIAVAAVILLVALVMIGNSLGLYDLGPSAPVAASEPVLTPAEQEKQSIEIKQAKEQMERDAQRPGTIKAGE